ncbi:MAG: ECF-type sigma factor [Pseudomonadota bacterium]
MAKTPANDPSEVTALLREHADREQSAVSSVLPLVYRELKALAHAQLGRSGVRQELQTTALVHEAYEKLAQEKPRAFQDRRHFLATAARAMRQIVVDTYRSSSAQKRGGGVKVESLNTNSVADLANPADVLKMDQAMQVLAQENEELAELIDLTCFAGLSTAEVADLKGSSERTVQRQLKRARAWVSHILDQHS